MLNLKNLKKNKSENERIDLAKPKNKRRLDSVLLMIILLGLILRLTGIQHGFPFIFHPDEPTIIRSALGIRFNANPQHFDWPHLYIYINYFLYMIFAKFRGLLEVTNLKELVIGKFPLIWNDNLIFYYLTRCLSAILGALTAIPVYLSGKSLFGRKVGLLGALAIVLMPYHVWHSHYSMGDIPSAFLLAWGMYYSTLIIKTEKRKNYILAGLFIGLSASIKYNGGLSALMVPVAHFLRIFWANRDKDKIKNFGRIFLNQEGIKSLFFSGLFAFLGFLIGTPFALFDFKTFSSKEYGRGAFWQFTNVGSVNSSQHFDKFISESFDRLLVDTGYVVIPVFFVVLAFTFYRILKKKAEEQDLFLTLFLFVSLFMIWYESGFKNNRSHYYFIVYPFLAVIFGYFLNYVQEGFKNNVANFKNLKLSRVLSFLIIPILMLPLLTKSTINAKTYYAGDTRTTFYHWLSDNSIAGEVAVYNDSSLKEVFTLARLSSSKSPSSFKLYDKALIVLYEPDDKDREFVEKNKELIEEVVKFDGSGRLGSDIEVYRYSKPVVSKPVNTGSCCGCGR